MSITIRDCEHSDETTSRWYFKHPDKCFYCAYEAKYGPPKRLYKPKQPAWIQPNFKPNLSGLVRYRLGKNRGLKSKI